MRLLQRAGRQLDDHRDAAGITLPNAARERIKQALAQADGQSGPN
jgi:hypothetical protein